MTKDSSGKSSDGRKEQDEKKTKVEQNTSAPVHSKQSVKQNKDDSHSGEAPQEDFIHVRARRGQATNSHSLAERVPPSLIRMFVARIPFLIVNVRSYGTFLFAGKERKD